MTWKNSVPRDPIELSVQLTQTNKQAKAQAFILFYSILTVTLL